MFVLEAQKFRNLLALNFMLIETYFKGYQCGVIERKLIGKSEAVTDPLEHMLAFLSSAFGSGLCPNSEN